MPTYDYRCDACGHAFEKFQPITASPVRTCPACKKRTVKRLIGTGAGIIFKGSGFYQTDYRSESYKKAAQKDSPGGDSSSSDAPAKGGDAPAKGAKDAKSPSSESGTGD